MAARADKTMKVETLYRSFGLERAKMDKEKRTVRVQFSSETPVQRWFGSEILSHENGACDLSRMKAGASVLMEHDPNQRVGITEDAEITAGKTGEAIVRFARTPLGDQCMAEVEDGTLRWLSVGYVVRKFQITGEEGDEEEEYRAVSWQPLEVSFVAIPADPSARVMRSGAVQHEVILMSDTNQNQSAAVVTPPDTSRELNEGMEILALAGHYQARHPEVVEAAQKAIKDKTPLVKFQRQVMDIIAKPGVEDISAPAIGHGQAQAKRGPQSLGERFVNSAQYRELRKRGRLQKGVHIAVDLPDDFQFRADYGMLTRVNFGIGTSDVSGSTDIGGTSGANIDQQKQFNLLGTQPLVIADLFSQGATGGDVVRYIRELTFTNTAARVAEAGAKPTSNLDVGVVNATVEKTAVYLDVTEEMMNDWQQASSFINSRLAFMVQQKEEDYLLNGTGSSQITGILQTSGIQTVSGATNTVDQLLRAKAYVEGANGSGFAMPDAFVMNPLDWLNVRLTKDGNGQYLFGGPGYAPYGVGGFSNVGLMWGLPVVTSTLIAQGTALVGAFRQGAQIFRRQGVTIKTTDSDGSKFLSNIITVLAESRFTLAVYQPNKFCSITSIPSV